VGCQPDYDTRPPALPGLSWRLAVILSLAVHRRGGGKSRVAWSLL